MKCVLAICGFAWMLVGCTTAMRPVVYLPARTHPHFVEYTISGYAGQTRFLADGTRACYEHSRYRREFQHGPGFTLEYQVQCLPDADEWQKFWRAVDGLKLSRWKSSYSQFDVPPGPNGDRTIISDLAGWTLKISTPQGSWKIEGEGAYPIAGHPERVAIPDFTKKQERDALESLETAFQDLMGLPHSGGSE